MQNINVRGQGMRASKSKSISNLPCKYAVIEWAAEHQYIFIFWFFLPVNYTWLIMLSRCLHKEFTWFWAKCNAFYCILVSDKCCHAFSRRVPQSSHIIVRSSQVQTTRFRFIYTPSSFISYSTTNVPMSRFNRADPIIVLKCCQRLWWKHRLDILDRQDVFLREM